VTGALGGAWRSEKHLTFVPRLDEARRIRTLAGADVHACIDITDGLARDLNHVCEESLRGARIEADAIPLRAVEEPSGRGGKDSGEALRRALEDGEDFELLLAVAPPAAARLLDAWDMATPLHAIGSVLPEGAGLWIECADGTRRPLPDLGYEHPTGRGDVR